MSRRNRRVWAAAGAVSIALALALAVAAGAGSAGSGRLLTLDNIVVANGTATVAGTVGADGVGAVLTINGHPIGIDLNGHFAATIDLGGADVLHLSIAGASNGTTTSFDIPLSRGLLGLGGLISVDVLDAVQRAAATLLLPPGGFSIVDGQPLVVSGHVADRSQLVSLSINGIDLLGRLLGDGSFTVQVPGTTNTLTLTSTDSKGVSESTQYAVSNPVSNTSRTSRGSSVAAPNAVGLRVAAVRYFTKGVVRTRRLRMLVTVKDSRGHLVQGARVIVRSKAAGRLTRRSQVKPSNLQGRAAFVLRVRRHMLGRRLVMVTAARTPTARAAKTTSVRLAKSRRLSHRAH